MTVPLFELLATFTTTLPRSRPLPAFFLHALVTPATDLVHFKDQLATAFAFIRCHWIAPGHSVTSLGEGCNATGHARGHVPSGLLDNNSLAKRIVSLFSVPFYMDIIATLRKSSSPLRCLGGRQPSSNFRAVG